MQSIKLSEVRLEVRKKISPYLRKLIDIHKDNIVSVNLYGSAAGKDFSAKTSDVNLLVVLRKLELEDLKKSLKLVNEGIHKKISAPLFLTLRHIETSQDVFPMEFLEMKENYICIYGEDVLEGLEVTRDNIRLFCEEQIKGKLIRLRQAYLEIGLRKRGIEALMKESMYALMPVFRNLIRINGLAPPICKEAVLTALAKDFDLDKDVFIAILKDERDDEKIAGHDVEVYFAKYLAQIQKLAIAVDKL